jgi:cardiolipin synthase
LLEAGVRIFEWNGTMVHAKSAVADSLWCRVGSTNLNLNSWIGNWELDVAIEDQGVARTFEGHFQEDMALSTEIILTTYRTRQARSAVGGGVLNASSGLRHRVSRRVVRAVTGASHSIGAAVTGNRLLEDFEAVPLATAALVLTVIATLGFFAPHVLAWPVAALAAWMATTLIVEAWAVWRRRRP